MQILKTLAVAINFVLNKVIWPKHELNMYIPKQLYKHRMAIIIAKIVTLILSILLAVIIKIMSMIITIILVAINNNSIVNFCCCIYFYLSELKRTIFPILWCILVLLICFIFKTPYSIILNTSFCIQLLTTNHSTLCKWTC